jgi:glycosyltransferase involved in cell wall biosynthesis
MAKLLLHGKIILDAGWSLFEGTYISRKKVGFLGYLLIKNYAIDFVSSHLAHRVLLESELQAEFYCRIFLLSCRKVNVVYTGVDERAFVPDKNFCLPSSLKVPVVLFRGKYNPEAGLETLAAASHLLANFKVTLWVVSPGLPKNITFATNTIVDRDSHTKSEMASMLNNCTISLGQLADHPRLQRTIPHKAFESAFLATPYLSARSNGILELFEEVSDIACFNPGDPQDLADQIISLLSNLNRTNDFGLRMKRTYNLRCSQNILAKNFLQVVDKLAS